METIKRALMAGDKHYNNGRTKESLQSYIKALKLTRGLQEKSDILNEDLCHAYFVSVLRICDIVKVTDDKETLINLYKHMLLTPSNKLIDNMICCERIGDILTSLGSYTEALHRYEQQNAFARIPGDEYYSDFYYMRSLIVSYERIGQTLFKLGRYNDALKNFVDANDCINEGIRRGHPLMVEASAILKDIKRTKEIIRGSQEANIQSKNVQKYANGGD